MAVKNPNDRFGIKGVNPNLDKEAIRVIKTLPKFTPGKINDKPVRTSMSLP